MRDEIDLLNQKLNYLNIGSRRLDSLYQKSLKQVKDLQNQLISCEKIDIKDTCGRVVEGNGP